MATIKYRLFLKFSILDYKLANLFREGCIKWTLAHTLLWESL